MEACIGVLGIQDICHSNSRDTVFNILVTFRGIENLGKSIMGIFASKFYKGYLPVYFNGYGIFDTRTQASIGNRRFHANYNSNIFIHSFSVS